ncbi:MAG TPA: 50S ribosomal protein L9 [Bacteroidaceae bacterium]|nr:50S ribosomal protein L9 [Bacteroidaceae bacterium]
MELILKEDIAKLGYKNDIVRVKDGYGRNYLIPKGLAVIATEQAKKVLAEDLRQRAHKLEKIKQEAEQIAAKFEGISLEIPVKTSKSGSVFGGVSSTRIAEELLKKGIEIDRKKIEVASSIKTVGSYIAVITLHKEVSVEVPYEVVAEITE